MPIPNLRAQPWIVVTNSRSGASDQLTNLRNALEQGHPNIHLRVAKSGRSLQRHMLAAAREAKATGALLVAHGGDGTLNLAVAQALEHDIPLAVLPGGTFNYFARELGIPKDPVEAIKSVRQGQLQAVDIAAINGQPFLLNVSLGLHSRLLRERERDMRQLGRSQLVAAWSTLKGLLRRQSPLNLRLVDRQRDDRVRAAALTIIRSPIQIDELGLSGARDGDLALMMSAAGSRWELLRAALHLRLRRPHAEPTLQVRRSDQFELHSNARRTKRRIRLSIDGESRELTLPLSIAVLKGKLRIALPKP